MIKKLIISSIISIFLVSCFSTNPKNVKTSDAQKISKVDYGRIISSLPVKIKGEGNWVGATAGAMIGGLLGTQLCGDKEIVGTKCQDIGVVFGAIGGAAAGTACGKLLRAAAAAAAVRGRSNLGRHPVRRHVRHIRIPP
jgi:outer membrane lipoprotein SlyB